MNKILFVNHRTKECGVHQAGARYFDAFKESKKYELHYIDVDGSNEYEYWINQLNPAAVIFNFYSGATMHWLSNDLINQNRNNFFQLCIYHELDLSSKGFDLILHQDPTTEDPFPHWKLPRAIPEYFHSHPPPIHIPIFTSFGFGLGGKGYSELVRQVQEEYDNALIRLHIPYAYFGDREGKGAHDCVEDARRQVVKPGIIFYAQHEFLSESELLSFLASSTCNCFFYEPNYGRGISSVTDYALSVRKPIAITQSYQFRHLWTIDDSFLIEHKSLHEIVAMGTDHLEKFHQMWSRENLVRSFEDALESLGV